MKRFIAVMVGWVFCSQSVFAQYKATGQVRDAESGQPLPGVSIVASNSQTGTTTRPDGTYVLSLRSGADSLHFSLLGYHRLTLVSDTNRDVLLHPLAQALNPLIITASRRATRRSEAPVAIDVITPATLRQVKPIRLEEVLNQVSGVYMVDLGNEQHTMSIRQPISYRSNFLYLQDGLPIRTIGDFNHNALLEINQAAVERIEIIKGPSSSLYGSDAVGGVVNFITKRPPAQPALDAALIGNTNGYKRINLSAGNSWQHTGLLISGSYIRQRDGYRAHSDLDKGAITVRLDHQLDARNRLTAQLTSVQYNSDMTGGLDSAHFYGKNYQSFYTFNYRKVQAWRGRLSWEHQGQHHDNSQLIFYYRNNAVDQNPHYRIQETNDPLKAKGEINRDFFSSYGIEGQYFRPIPRWQSRVTAGFQTAYSPYGYQANFIRIRKNEAGYFTGYTPTDSLLTDYQTDIWTIAGYLRWESKLTQRLRLVGGLRYDWLHYRFDNALPPSAYSGAPDGRNNFRQLSPKLGATYDFGKDRGIYANYSLGFAPADISDLYTGVRIPHLRSARYGNLEVGGWMAFAHNAGYAAVSLYRMKGKDEIISVRRANGAYYKKNAGETMHYGLEYTLQYTPVPAWSFRFSGTQARHLFLRYEENGKDLSDKEMNGAPHWMFHAQVRYSPAFVPGLHAALEWQHLSAYYMDPANTMRYPGYDLFSARLRYTYKRLECWTKLHNIFNCRYATTAEKSAYAVTYRPGDPRILSLGIGYHFKGKKHE